MKKAGERARLCSPQDLPAVVHQLLMLSRSGCREQILGVRPVGRERLPGLVALKAQRRFAAFARLQTNQPAVCCSSRCWTHSWLG